MNHKTLGDNGERLAEAYLVNLGYSIKARNYRSRYGELDIIACEGDEYVFVEVKTRRSHRYGKGIEAITPAKVDKLRYMAQEYIAEELGYEPACRFDIIDILMTSEPSIQHTRNAF